MRKIITLLAVIGMFGFQGCTGPEGPPGVPGQDGLTPTAFELRNVSLARVTDRHYELKRTFASTALAGDLYDDETVLIYRMTGTINSSTPIWQSIPRSIYFSDGNVLDYDYDFSKVDFVISADGTYNLFNEPNIINQTFRLVIVPSDLINKVDKNNYYQVMSVLKLSEDQIQKIDMK
ncbi:hypothetical protein [Flavobacterium aquiphilum]|uniref:hypothetical protein n=1 Tax=Flavobacterium aquiphilum TaxID=3003261 RepID=UPI00247FE9D3|nr:hypothetical protein [Flavobacterium aquiphilum]